MRCTNLIGLTLLLIITSVAGQPFRDVIDRHNFGFTLERQGEIRIATVSANVIFYYELPSLSDRNYEDIDCSSVADGMRRPCENIKLMLIAFRSIRTRAANYLRRELHYIYDVFYRVPAEPSRKRGFFTNVFSSIMGLETKEHVNELKQLMASPNQSILCLS